jgi:hypothetical protein
MSANSLARSMICSPPQRSLPFRAKFRTKHLRSVTAPPRYFLLTRYSPTRLIAMLRNLRGEKIFLSLAPQPVHFRTALYEREQMTALVSMDQVLRARLTISLLWQQKCRTNGHGSQKKLGTYSNGDSYSLANQDVVKQGGVDQTTGLLN